MRDREIALECLRLACTQPSYPDPTELAAEFYAFVTSDDAVDKLAKAREALK